MLTWWMKSQRMYQIHQKILSDDDANPVLSYEQVYKLWLAKAIYQTVPAVIMTPYAYHCLKQAIGGQTLK